MAIASRIIWRRSLGYVAGHMGHRSPSMSSTLASQNLVSLRRIRSSAATCNASMRIFHLAQELGESLRNRRGAASSPLRDGRSSLTASDNDRRATDLCETYGSLPPLKSSFDDTCERSKIVHYFAIESQVKNDTVLAGIDSFRKSGSAASLRQCCTPPYEEIFRYLLKHNSTQALIFILALRSDVMLAIAETKTRGTTHELRLWLAALQEFDAYLCDRLNEWFSVGSLRAERITYKETSAAIIEQIATKEAVHPMKSLDDLRIRLGPGRRVFSLFHALLPDTPLVILHVSLQKNVVSSMSSVLETTVETGHPTVAVFYSISNAQRGLAGIGLGEVLLKKAIGALRSEFHEMKDFATISPLPKFRKWLEGKINQSLPENAFYDNTLISSEDVEALIGHGYVSKSFDKSPYSCLKELVTLLSSRESIDKFRGTVIEEVVSKLAARYLVDEKHRGKPLDAVARFHLGNGASLYRINYGADLSRKGIHDSFGMMVNYKYDIANLEENKRRFETDNSISVLPQAFSKL